MVGTDTGDTAMGVAMGMGMVDMVTDMATVTEPATTVSGLAMAWVTAALATGASATAAITPVTSRRIPATERATLPLAECCIVAYGRVAGTDSIDEVRNLGKRWISSAPSSDLRRGEIGSRLMLTRWEP
jgi:hypothetical protein